MSSEPENDAHNRRYIRERIQPEPKDEFYLHLSDLLAALKRHATTAEINILDYGCGLSPYKSLFQNAKYMRADLPGRPGIDYVVDGSGCVNAPSSYFDLVLSTQVLEHCPRPEVYLNECRRVLKKGGKLLLSTHGLFEEHDFPFDYYRWTEDGLRADISRCGFEVESVAKLTVGPRAGLMFAQRSIALVSTAERSWETRLCWRGVRRIFLKWSYLWNGLVDKVFPEYQVITGKELLGSSIYIALFVVAKAK